MKPWGKYQDDRIRQLRADGVPIARIATMTERSESSVRNRLYKLDRKARGEVAESPRRRSGGAGKGSPSRFRSEDLARILRRRGWTVVEPQRSDEPLSGVVQL